MSEAQAVKIAELQQTNADLKDAVVDLLNGPETVERQGEPQGAAWDRTQSNARTAVIKAIEGDG